MINEHENDAYENDVKIFKAFADEKRLRILEQLRVGEECAGALLEKQNLSQSGLSYHMKILCESGVVESRQDGKWTYYKISNNGSRLALELLEVLTTPDLKQTIEYCI